MNPSFFHVGTDLRSIHEAICWLVLSVFGTWENENVIRQRIPQMHLGTYDAEIVFLRYSFHSTSQLDAANFADVLRFYHQVPCLKVKLGLGMHL